MDTSTIVVSIKRVDSDTDVVSLDAADPAVFAAGCAMLLAAAQGDVARIKNALANGMRANFSDYDQRTALHVAASEGHLSLVEFLVDKGARINRIDRWGGTALDDAMRHHHSVVAEYLRGAGGKRGTGVQLTAVIQAAASGDVTELRALLADDEAAAAACDYDKRTALHLAASEGHATAIACLLENGADVNALDRFGGRPLDDAIHKGNAECAKLLEAAGATKGELTARDGRRKSGDLEIESGSNLEVSMDDVTLLDKIGAGAFGDIWRARWRGTAVAAKLIKAKGTVEDERQAALEDFRLETQILCQLRHPNICLMLGYSMTEHHEVMISELMRCSLADVFKTLSVDGVSMALRRALRYAIMLAQA